MAPALASLIDSTLLRPEASDAEVARHCEEAAELGCASAFVLPIWLPLCVSILEGASTRPGVPVNFPSGAAPRELAEAEVEHAAAAGAAEVDMVLPIGLFRSGRLGEVVEFVHAAASRIHEAGGIIKVIIEAPLLSEDEIRRAVQLAADGGVDFVKSGTGLHGPATVEQIRLMREAAPRGVEVKAAGGIRGYGLAVSLVEAGATRLGTSAARAVLDAG